jgi:hypothetical protein
MCNILTFRFACTHTLPHRRSRCAGTKHRVTATSIRAACTAQSFLELRLRTACGPCQQAAWDASWKARLARANAFLTGLRERDLPGAREVGDLVKGLGEEYAREEWGSRSVFAGANKAGAARVKHSYHVRTASKLPYEVRPEDVVETRAKEWADMDERDYDGDYVASSDPIHPVSTDYTHPWEDDDGAWAVRYLEAEGGDGDGAGEDALDLDAHGSWVWDGGGDASASNENTESTTRDSETQTTHHDGWPGHQDDSPDASPDATTQLASNDARPAPEHTAQISQVIQAFWSLLDAATTPPQPPLPTTLHHHHHYLQFAPQRH